ncbi:MAG: T9SS type A sorting domain-containing protein [bacterium]
MSLRSVIFSMLILLSSSIYSQNGIISMGYVDGLSGPFEITTGQEITFNLRFQNNTGSNIYGLTNGFKIYSPDGATWNTSIGDTTGILGLEEFTLAIFLDEYSVTGSGIDTLGLGMVSLFGPGMITGFDGYPYTITIGPIDPIHEGKTICIDSSFFPPSGTWRWASNQGSYIPQWNGPYCYTITAPPVAFFSLDNVEGAIAPDTLLTDTPIRFDIRLRYIGDDSIFTMTNGFRVYSPDGAYWQSTTPDTTGALGKNQMDLFFIIGETNVDGLGADTVGYSGATLFGPGLTAPFDEVVYTISLGSIDSIFDGKTICLDSCFFRPVSEWKFITQSGRVIIPMWDGPHTFHIKAPRSGEVILDNVSGLTAPDSVGTNDPITFTFRLTNGSMKSVYGINQGFRVYSPDGARWTTTSGDTTGTLGLAQFDQGVFINNFSVSGSGADTIGFVMNRQYGTGMVDGFDDNVFTVTLGPINVDYSGKTICIDSCWFPPNNPWVWSMSDASVMPPTWNGPFCYGIQAVYDAEASLDHVDGLYAKDSVAVNESLTFTIRLKNSSDESVRALSQGFRIYSPDGALWTETIGDTTGTLGLSEFDGFVVINNSNATGAGADTISFSMFKDYGTGMPSGFDDNVFTITAGPINENSRGKTICLDSSWYPPDGPWTWAMTDNTFLYPTWDGPHCYKIVDPSFIPGNGEIYLAGVSNTYGDHVVHTGEKITFDIGWNNNTGYAIDGFTTGFQIYSPTGAEWTTTDAISTGSIGPIEFPLAFQVVEFNPTGSGVDTVGFGGLDIFGPGLYDGYHDIPFQIEIGPIPHQYNGGTICLDSCFYPPGGQWLWSLKNSSPIKPEWDGPHCFDIETYIADSVIIPSVSTGNPCYGRQPVMTKLTQSITGLSIPIEIPLNIYVDSISFDGLITENWDVKYCEINHPNRFIYVELDNFHGYEIPADTTTVFNIHFTSDAECFVDHVLHWDTISTGNTDQTLIFSDVSKNDLSAAFDRLRDLSTDYGSRPGDIDGNQKVNVADLTYYVDFIFKGGPESCPYTILDANNSCTGPNVADLTYLVNYIFKGGADPFCGCLGKNGMMAPKFNQNIDVSTVYINGTTVVSINTPIALKGIQLEFTDADDIAIENLIGDNFNMLTGQFEEKSIVGLLDMNGENTLVPGNYDLVRIQCEVNLTSCIISDMRHKDYEVSINNAVKPTFIPDHYALSQNYPNPFNPITEISFDLPEASHVNIEIYNITGQRITSLVDDYMEAGAYSIPWDGSGFASGVYLYRMETEHYTRTLKMILLK